VLEIKDLCIQLGDFFLDHVSFQVNKGEFFIILGPTGAGKSVVVETIGGILQPDQGQILMHQKDITKKPPELRNMSLCYQDYILFPHMTVEENIRYGMTYKKDTDPDLFYRLIDRLKIRSLLTRNPENLSGGEKQRVSIARAMIILPEVLLLDEPLAALDSHIKDQLMRDIKQIHQDFKMTTIMITHSFQEAFFLGERGCIIHEGKVLQTGSMEEIFIHPNSPFVSNFVGLKNVFHSDLFREIPVESPYFGIRPENIKLENTTTDYSYQGTIEEINDMGSFYELTILSRIGKITALLMISDYIQKNLITNTDIVFGFNLKDLIPIQQYYS